LICCVFGLLESADLAPIDDGDAGSDGGIIGLGGAGVGAGACATVIVETREIAVNTMPNILDTLSSAGEPSIVVIE
jgi:hypothetical protein